MVDQWSGFSTSTDTYDAVHPNASGDQKMADRWYPPLTAQLTPSGSTTTTTTPVTTVPTTTTSPGGTGCAATFRVVTTWPGYFQGEVGVRNTGSAAITGWTVRWRFADGETITQYFNGQVTQTGADVTARNVSWNGNLAPNASAAFGFIATQNGTITVPAPSCTPA